MPWAALASAALVWSLLGLAGRLGEPHPTLSTLVASLTEAPVARVLLFVAWLGGGWLLLRRRTA